MPVDFLGNNIEVGDIVLTYQLGYRNFIKCEIVKITPKMVFLKAGRHEFKQFHYQIINLKYMKNN